MPTQDSNLNHTKSIAGKIMHFEPKIWEEWWNFCFDTLLITFTTNRTHNNKEERKKEQTNRRSFLIRKMVTSRANSECWWRSKGERRWGWQRWHDLRVSTNTTVSIVSILYLSINSLLHSHFCHYSTSLFFCSTHPYIQAQDSSEKEKEEE